MGAIVIVLAAMTFVGEKVALAEIALGEGATLDEATLQQALESSPACAGFQVEKLEAAGEARILATVTGVRGQCCLDPVKTALAKVAGVEKVECTLLRK